jgi:5-methylcytosine-specific restriction enzyme subunit McrC
MRHNFARPDRLHCTFDEFTEDNLLNRVLKAALRVLVEVAVGATASKNVAELLFCFQDVSDVSRSSIIFERVGTDRLTRRYAPLLRMARLFIEGASPDLMSGQGEGFAILFDMNELFEAYVGRVAIRTFGAAGFKVSLQGPRRHLTKSHSGDGAFELRPDIVVNSSSCLPLIIDTKWKRLKKGSAREAVSSADMYQMAAYSHRYDAVEVVLLYPHHFELGDWKACRNRYSLHDTATDVDGQARFVSISTVDLKDLKLIPEQLRKISKLTY